MGTRRTANAENKTRDWDGSMRITRAIPGTMGQKVETVILTREAAKQMDTAENWLSDDSIHMSAHEERSSKSSGFAQYEDQRGQLGVEPYDVERFAGSLSDKEAKAITETTDRGGLLMSQARVTRDPVTRIPDNIAEQDSGSVSDNFFGAEKVEPELTRTLERIQDTPNKREQVDYRRSEAIPIKMV